MEWWLAVFVVWGLAWAGVWWIEHDLDPPPGPPHPGLW